MSDLHDLDWEFIYESQSSQRRPYLVDEFYEPALERSTRYDRVAGNFSSTTLAAAAKGIHALVGNNGEMRLVVGAALDESDRPVPEGLTDHLEERLAEPDNERLDANLQIMARLLRADRIHIKVAVTQGVDNDWEVFHPRLGLCHDENGDTISFEGSVTETVEGGTNNDERFKLHRSWIPEQAEYVSGDKATFERLWGDEHPEVRVFDLPDAIEQEIIDWKDPGSEPALDELAAIVKGTAPPTERDKANIIQDGPLSPGGLALAEQGTAITPSPHQRVVSDTLVNTYPQSFLLGDELGLGKMIETGLTLSRLSLTGDLETALLLAPANRTIQWHEELWETFNLNTYRYERTSDGGYKFVDAFGREHVPSLPYDMDLSVEELEQAWTESSIWRLIHEHQASDRDGPAIVIMSWHSAFINGRLDQLAPRNHGEVRTQEDVPASCRGRQSTGREGVWDGIVVDNVHNDHERQDIVTLLKGLRDHTQTYYLLTAPPDQYQADELFDLMNLLDLPGAWSQQTEFVQFFNTRQAIQQALDAVLDSGDSDKKPQWPHTTRDASRDQGRRSADRSVSNRVFDAIAKELDVTKQDNAHATAKQRVLQACDLASDYGTHYDGYDEIFKTAVEQHGVDPIDANEAELLKALLYPGKVNKQEGVSSRERRLGALDTLTEAGWQVITDVLQEATPVDALIHRNTRDTLRKYDQAGLLDETVPTRNLKQRNVELRDKTRRAYDRIDEYTRSFYTLAQRSDEADSRAIGFVMTAYRQRLASSIHAVSQTLQTRLEILRRQLTEDKQQRLTSGEWSQTALLDALRVYDLDDLGGLAELDGNVEYTPLSEFTPAVTPEGTDLLNREIEALESFIHNLQGIDRDPKVDQLVDDLDALKQEGHDRVVIFTQYTDTMEVIRDRLVTTQGEKVATYSGRGGELYDGDEDSWTTVGKEWVKREFAAEDGQVDILVCTDSASGGLNLEECGALINFDLPWNPMQVEQRIGRVDRIGQRFDEVTIINYSYADTIESAIYDTLTDRIGLFETVGDELRPLLSEVPRRIRDATLKTDHDETQQVIEKTERAIERDIETQNHGVRVGIGESLENITSLDPQELIDKAQIDAWRSYEHPDLVDTGKSEYQYTGAFQTTSIEAVVADSETLEEHGVTLTPVTHLDIDLDESGYPDAETYTDTIYRLTVDDTPIQAPETNRDRTLASLIAPGAKEIAVTGSPGCAAEFPSLEYLAAGNPLVEQLTDIILEGSEAPQMLQRHTEYRDQDSTEPLVSGWTHNGCLTALDADGNVSETLDSTTLSTWRDQFLTTRGDSPSS